MCDAIYRQWVDETQQLAATPALRQKYAVLLATSGQLIQQADAIRSSQFSDPSGCASRIDALYSMVVRDLHTALYGQESKEDQNEFPWTEMVRQDIHLTRGPQSMSGHRPRHRRMRMADFIDPQGQVRPDTALSSAVHAALRMYYDLRPVGSETAAQLENRIVGVFMQRYGDNWNKGMNPEDIIADVSLREVVADVSPLTTEKPAWNPTTDITRLPSFDWVIWAALGLGLGYVAVKATGKKKRKRG